MSKLPDLFVSLKEKAASDSSQIPNAFRQIEQWVKSVVISAGSFYASLTGAGETVTPGDLTQAGGLTVNSTTQVTLQDNGTTGITIQELGTGPIFISNNGSYVEVNSQANGVLIFGASGTTGNAVTISNVPSFSGLVSGLIQVVSNGSVQLQYDRIHTASRGTNFVSISDNQALKTVHLYVNGGNPNGAITPQSNGDICFDVGTPGLWIASGGTWTMYTNP